MADLKITNVERLILANQYEILSKLEGGAGYAELAEHLRNGHEFLYSDSLRFYVSENLGQEKTEYVLSVLAMFFSLQHSYDRLDDKSGINADDVKFDGFDGNNESELLRFTYALYKAGSYTDILLEGGRNSHMPTTDIYSRMLEEWKNRGEPRSNMDKETIIAILNARTHPSRR